MSRKNTVALVLVGAMMVTGATSATAAVWTHAKSAKSTAHARWRRQAHVRYVHPGWYASSFGPMVDSHAPGTWHLNRFGYPYQVPYPCAYPLGYDSGGAAVFQMYGCPLP